MAKYKSGSRFLGGVEGETFDETKIVFQRDINVDEIVISSTITISARQEFRPDLISLDHYLRPDLGWFIMLANQLDHISQFKAGSSIGIPSISGFIR
jgi:hypothetical protein